MKEEGQAMKPAPLMLRLPSASRAQPSNSAFRGPPWPEVT